MRKVIGVTGLMGSGKSYAMSIFCDICRKENIVATFINVDDVRRKILDDANVDRIALNQIIYDDPQAMDNYRRFINPKIRKYLLEEIHKSDGFVFIEWALLIEDKLFDLCDFLLITCCDENIQFNRLMGGDLTKESVLKRLKLQSSLKDKMRMLNSFNCPYFLLDTSSNPPISSYTDFLTYEVCIYE